MSSSATRPGRLKIGVISAGKVGATIAAALRATGHTITGAYAHSEASTDRLEAMLPGVPAMEIEQIAAASEMILLAVPDDELGPLVAGMAKLGLWKRGHLAVHVAGRFGTGVLDPALEAGAIPLAIHPAMTFTGTSLDLKRLIECPFGITASPMFLPIGQALVEEIGGHAVPIEEEDRGLYHAAICHGANHAVTLVNQAMRMLQSLGIEDPGTYLAPLVHASIDGALRSGEKLLTGPVVRGDAGTVAEHLEAIDALAATDNATDIPPVYRALATATAERAHVRQVLSDSQLHAVMGAIGVMED